MRPHFLREKWGRIYFTENKSVPGPEGGEVERLAEIIRAFTEAAWGEGVAVVDVSYEEMGRA